MFRFLWRAFLFLFSLLLGFLALAILSESRLTLAIPLLSFNAVGAQPSQYLDPRNGLMLTFSVVCGLSALLVFNRSLRQSSGYGPIDRLLERVGGGGHGNGEAYKVAAVLGLVISSAVVLWIWFMVLDIHTDPEIAAEAFATKIESSKLTNTNRVLFGKAEDGTVHAARLTPSLIRILDRRSVSLGGDRWRERELALPGFLPLVFLLLLCITVVVLARWRPRERNDSPEKPRGFQVMAALVCGVISFYVIFWFIAGQYGNELQIFSRPADFMAISQGDMQREAKLLDDARTVWLGLNFYVRMVEWKTWTWVTVFLTAVVIGVLRKKFRNPSISSTTRAGWMSLFFALQAAILCGILCVSHYSDGSPVVLWVAAYLTICFACWLACLPSNSAEKPA